MRGQGDILLKPRQRLGWLVESGCAGMIPGLWPYTNAKPFSGHPTQCQGFQVPDQHVGHFKLPDSVI